MTSQTKEVIQIIKDFKHDGMIIIPEVEAMMLEISKLDECNYNAGADWCAFSVLPQRDNSFNVTDSYGAGDEDYLHFKYLESTKQWFDIKENAAISVIGIKNKIEIALKEWINLHEYYNNQ